MPPSIAGEEPILDVIPHGVFSAELSDAQKAAILRAIDLGRALQKELPSVADDFRSGSTLDEIVERHDLRARFGGSHSTARTAVWYALRGYHEDIRFTGAHSFEGLIGETEYDGLARKHVADASAETGRKNKESGLKQFAERRGIHAHTPEERSETGRRGAVAQGSRPYEKNELDLIAVLVTDPEYRRQSRINAIKIAQELNKRLYGGESIRTPTQIRKMWHTSKSHAKAN